MKNANVYEISINQLAEFYSGTEATKRRIISQQKTPSKFRLPWYQSSKSSIKKSLAKNGSIEPIRETIGTLRAKPSGTKWQNNNRDGSIDALERFVEMRLPSLLKELDYEVIKPEEKRVAINDVDVIVAPDIVVRAKFDDKVVYGAVKIHISKNSPFDLQQSRIVASTIYRYLNEKVVGDDELVMPELCFSLDVFGGRIVPATDAAVIFNEIESLCDNIKEVWDQIR